MSFIRKLEKSERPREKLARLGAMALTDKELLALLLGSGSGRADVITLASHVVAAADRHNLNLSIEHLMEIPGMGLAKASAIVGALEFSRRRIASDGIKIREPADIIPLITHLADRKQETFICVSLNGAHEVIASRIVTIGLANACQVHPREVLADPLIDRACAIIVAHNHPSGDLTPSEEDRKVTARLKSAAQVLGINFLDHIIFGKRGFASID